MTAEVVTALGSEGDGVIEHEGRKSFLPFALPGEVIERGQLLAASPDRVEPPCPHHGNLGRAGCGGCRMQHLDLAAYAEWKRGLVIEALKWSGVPHPPIEPLHMSPLRSRRRAALTLERHAGRLRIGFNQRGTHNIVDLQTCLILRPELFVLIEPLRHLPLLREGERADMVLTASGGAIDLLLERRRDPDLGEREALAEFAATRDIARISWRAGPRQQAEPVCHRSPFNVRFGGYPVVIPPGGFLQATAEGEATLVSILCALPQGGRTIDLFAGSGTFTLPASAYGEVHAFEADARACAALTSVRAPGVTVERRNLFADPVTDFKPYTCVIIDPPYAGAEAQARALERSGATTIISISCNPLTFARDVAIMASGGYRVERIVAVDQFLWSAGVEIAAVLQSRA